MNLSQWLHQNWESIRNKFRFRVKNNKESLLFLLFFSLYSIIFFSIYFIIQDHLTGLLAVTAYISGSIAQLLGMPVNIEGVNILSSTMTFEIIHECTGIFAMIITVSSILAYPAERKQKISGIIFVIPFIYLLNLIRLEVLFYVGIYHNDLFDLVHSYLWQGTFIIFIILAWFLWIEQVVSRER